jgi:predicted dehydrogenase
MLRDRPGNVVILSGRNREKIGRIRAAIRAGLHVLADKPWVLSSADLPVLEAVLADADAGGLVAYDIMTERFEITNLLQREFVNDPDVFGEIIHGTEGEPGVCMESVHYLKKTVAGRPNIRPPWFFETAEQGEALSDVGTHLVDLVQWTLFPDQALDARSDIEITAAQRWPTPISEADFRSVTNTPGFPESLAASVRNGTLDYDGNTCVKYRIRGVHTRLNVIWDWAPPAGGGDTHFASYRGTSACVEVRQTRAEGDRPELYVAPRTPALQPQVLAAVRRRVEALQGAYPGVALEDRGGAWRVTIPDVFRVGHEAHFAQVTRQFLSYLRDRGSLPAWERPNMLAKYFITTMGTELSRRSGPARAPRMSPA